MSRRCRGMPLERAGRSAQPARAREAHQSKMSAAPPSLLQRRRPCIGARVKSTPLKRKGEASASGCGCAPRSDSSSSVSYGASAPPSAAAGTIGGRGAGAGGGAATCEAACAACARVVKRASHVGVGGASSPTAAQHSTRRMEGSAVPRAVLLQPVRVCDYTHDQSKKAPHTLQDTWLQPPSFSISAEQVGQALTSPLRSIATRPASCAMLRE